MGNKYYPIITYKTTERYPKQKEQIENHQETKLLDYQLVLNDTPFVAF